MKKIKDFTPDELKEIRRIILENTGYGLSDEQLLTQVFTRNSYSEDHGGENSEVLELIGDSVLNSIVIKLAVEWFGEHTADGEFRCKLRQNHLSELRSEIVCNKSLARVIDGWNIMKYLIIGRDEYDFINEKAKGDLFEAILGAMAVNSDFNMGVLEKVIKKSLDIESWFNSYSL